jgi:hypothetical protein
VAREAKKRSRAAALLSTSEEENKHQKISQQLAAMNSKQIKKRAGPNSSITFKSHPSA